MAEKNSLKSHCLNQLGRIAHHGGFPKEKTAVADYICALMVAGTQEGVTRVMDDITSQVWDWCPSAAMLRGKAYEQSEKRPVGCAECDGTGWVIVERGGYSGARECVCRKVTVSQ